MPPKNSSKTNISPEISWKAPACEPGKCRINCRKNPNCFSQLGEKFWFSAIKESHWVSSEDPEYERKEENSHVGLKNLGATCYVNTFLQLWFHNKPLRSAVYRWKSSEPPIETVEFADADSEDTSKGPKYISLSFGDGSTKAICGSLQYLFALLQYSERRYVDPTPLVTSLGLQTNEQQDAQEFSKLFISLLQEALSSQGQSYGNIIEQQFGGSYAYQTKCNVCNSISERPSTFYELDLNIKGHIKLSQCLKEFLKEELLEGDNQYFCSTCQQKRNATRRIVLQRLPRVLNLQLLRFVFDRQTFTKKKLNHCVNFPDLLDFNDFVTLENKKDGVYHLSAVLIHKGLSANSGHYIAHIWDKENEVWCRFNDEEVDVVKGKTLQLEKEETFEEDKVKMVKTKKVDGQHNSKNAYMLVYTRATDTEHNNMCIDPPNDMTEVVAKDNSLFEEWASSVKHLRSNSMCDGLEKQKAIQAIYSCLSVKEGDEFEWISTKWLRKWLSPDQKYIPPIDNTELMCSHSCVDPLKLTNMKRVSAEAADVLFERHGGLPRFKSDSMCQKCLNFIKMKHLFENKLQEDVKLFTKCLKPNYKLTDGYWVGKKSLKQFKQLATKEFMNSHGECVNNQFNSNSTNTLEYENSLTDSGDKNNNSNDDIQGDDENCLVPESPISSKNKLCAFNQEIICTEHGDLNLNEAVRKLVSKEVWLKCVEYFPSLKEFHSTKPDCLECKNKERTEKEEKETLKVFIANQKQCLSSFLLANPMERLDILLCQESVNLYVVAAKFVNTWKKRVKIGKSMHEPIDNTEMVCEHDLLMYSSEELIYEVSKKDPELIIVTEEEKDKLASFFTFAPEIKISMFITKDSKQTKYECTPDYCTECRNLRLSEEAFDSKSYQGVPIFVRKLTKDHNITVDESNKPNTDDSISSDISVSDDSKPIQSEKRDMDIESTFTPKRFKSSPSPSVFEDASKRRSTRHRRKRGEYVVYINSDQTLKELKVQLLPVFSVFPLEQILTFEDGFALTDDDKSLVDLGVTPGKHLFLSVAEQDKEQLEVEQGKERTREEGFKGTNLLCGGKV